ncbi:MAG: hypothetical protein JWN30_644 [Bacilli bacterium]|nr:hypothetical protein [Bacilli bacterium]
MKACTTDQELVINTLTAGRKIVAITGAGISVSAGLPLGDDEFEGAPVEKILTRPFFVRRPAQFYRWFRHCVREWSKASPTSAHQLLKLWGVDVITQNIDNLHMSTGSSRLIELHGSTRSLYCPRCRQRFPNHFHEQLAVPFCPTCNNVLHPDIVFVGEPVRHFSHAVVMTCKADIVLVIGTELTMLPCRGLVEIAKRNNTTVVSINEEADSFLMEVHAQTQFARGT